MKKLFYNQSLRTRMLSGKKSAAGCVGICYDTAGPVWLVICTEALIRKRE